MTGTGESGADARTTGGTGTESSRSIGSPRRQIQEVHRLEQLTNLNTCFVELFKEIVNYDLFLSAGGMECVTQTDQAAVNRLIL